MVEGPVSAGGSDGHEWDANSVRKRPTEACASNMSASSFEIKGQSGGAFKYQVVDGRKYLSNSLDIRPDDEIPQGLGISAAVSELGCSAKVVDEDGSRGPVSEDIGRVKGGDNLGLWNPGDGGVL